MDRALVFPSATVAHLEVDGAPGEVSDLAALERAGLRLGLVALPPAVEDSLYRYNNLPPRLAALYVGLDPFDPDEDVLEEAEEEAGALIDQAHLLDDVIDGVYAALEGLPAEVIVRRPGDARGVEAAGRRAVLLAIKRLYRSDWSVECASRRLARTASIAVDARAVIVHAAGAANDPSLSSRATDLLGRSVTVSAWQGAVTGVA